MGQDVTKSNLDGSDLIYWKKTNILVRVKHKLLLISFVEFLHKSNCNNGNLEGHRCSLPYTRTPNAGISNCTVSMTCHVLKHGRASKWHKSKYTYTQLNPSPLVGTKRVQQPNMYYLHNELKPLFTYNTTSCTTSSYASELHPW